MFMYCIVYVYLKSKQLKKKLTTKAIEKIIEQVLTARTYEKKIYLFQISRSNYYSKFVKASSIMHLYTTINSIFQYLH